MTIDSLPFDLRIGALLALFAAIAVAELAIRGRNARRWREYLFLLAAAAVGAVYGVVNDLITSSISPEYFTLGKQIASGPGFMARVARLGAAAGFSGGAIAACALLYANNPRPSYSRLPYRRLARLAILPATLAFLGSILGAGVGFSGIVRSQRANLFPHLDAATAESFCTVWLIHVGLYVGLFSGIAVGFARVRRSRRLAVEAIKAGAA